LPGRDDGADAGGELKGAPVAERRRRELAQVLARAVELLGGADAAVEDELGHEGAVHEGVGGELLVVLVLGFELGGSRRGT